MSDLNCPFCGGEQVSKTELVTSYDCGTDIQSNGTAWRDNDCYENEIIRLKKLLGRCAAAMIENDTDAQQQLISEIGGLNGKK